MIQLAVVFGLVTYRLVRFTIKDTLIASQRIWLLNRILGTKPGAMRGKLHEMLQCPHCVSAWIAAGVVAVTDAVTDLSLPPPVLLWVASWAMHELFWRVIEMPLDVHLRVTNVVRHKPAPYET